MAYADEEEYDEDPFAEEEESCQEETIPLFQGTGNARYWNNSGRYQKENEVLWNELVPASGEAQTREGELLRMANRLYYDAYNNGLGNDMTEEFELLNSAPELNLGFRLQREGITDDQLDSMMDKVLEYLLTKGRCRAIIASKNRAAETAQAPARFGLS